jgi:FkbM family methyltransferase
VPRTLSSPAAAITKWLGRLPLPRAVANRVYPLLARNPAIAVQMFDGSTLVSDIRYYQTREVLATGLFEPTITRLFATLVNPGDVVFDVGSNVGYFTILASRLVGPSGRVFAFEPLAINTAFIRASIAANHLQNVEVVEAFCGKREQDTVRMTVPTPDNLGTGSLVGADHSANACSVPTVTLSSFCRQRELNTIDFLKMDIEGAEVFAIPGMLDALDEHRFKLLAIEFHGDHLRQLGEDPMPYKRMFTERGYKAFEILPPDQLVDRTDTTLEGSFMVFAAPGTSIFDQRAIKLNEVPLIHHS